MLRYWLAFIMVLVPCLGLAIWAGREIDRNTEGKVESGFNAWCELARETARAQIIGEVQRITRLGSTAVSAPGTGWSRFAGLADEATVLAVVPIEEGWPTSLVTRTPTTLADHPLLREARRYEFVLADCSAAERYYHLATASDLPAPVREEGWSGLIACRIAGGNGSGAATALTAWLERDPPQSAESAVALALDLDQAGVPVIDSLLDLWRLIHDAGRPCPEDLAFALDQSIHARTERFTETQRTQWERRTQSLAPEQRTIAWWTGLDVLTRADAQAAVHPVCLPGAPDAVVVAVTDSQRQRSAVLALAPGRLAESAGAVLAANPTLNELSRTLGDRLQRDASMIAGLQVPVPWGGALAVPVPPSGDAGRWLGPRAMTWLVLAGAVVTVVVGFAALLVSARRDLRLARLKSDFVSNVSHELKTPIALVRLYAEMLSLGYVKDESERARAQTVIVTEAERLGLLVENVLDFARIERGERIYHTKPVDLAELIQRVVTAYQPQLETGGFTLSLDLAEGLPPIQGDPDALTQVLLNLLANACKFSPEDKRLSIVLTHEDGFLRWTISDHGIGIPVSEQQRIFQPFYRIESGLTRTTRGAGIGLALVHHIVTGHQGTIAVDSSPGLGTSIIIRLPTARKESCPTLPS